MESDIRTYVEQRRMENPDVIAAYDLQCEIERLEQALADHREQYGELMEKLARDGVKDVGLLPPDEIDVAGQHRDAAHQLFCRQHRG